MIGRIQKSIFTLYIFNTKSKESVNIWKNSLPKDTHLVKLFKSQTLSQ